MISASSKTHTRTRSREYLEALVSVEKAIELQDLSLERFQMETANTSKMRKILGHISVNRRSTEIIKTATFQEEMLVEVEEQFLYDDDAEMCETATVSPDALEVPQSPKLNSPSDQPEEHWSQLPLQAERLATAIGPAVDALGRYQPSPAEIAAMTVNDELFLAIEQDWMYDVVDLHIDYEALKAPPSVSQLPTSVAIQLWRIILESMAGFAKRNASIEPIYDFCQLEAFGTSKPNDLVGLGLLCGSSQSGGGYDSRPQLTT